MIFCITEKEIETGQVISRKGTLRSKDKSIKVNKDRKQKVKRVETTLRSRQVCPTEKKMI